MSKKTKKILKISLISLVLITFCIISILNWPFKASEQSSYIKGANFSSKFAKELGLNWQQAYLESLDDLGIRNYRLMAYWDEIEKEPGVYDFSDLDFLINQANLRGVKVILALGQKVPRWPECHEPGWVLNLSKSEKETRLLEYEKVVIERYQKFPAIKSWQIENEFYFPFGHCPAKVGLGTINKEVKQLRTLDKRPVVITDSGEWGVWFLAALAGDTLGISMYRESNDSLLGHINFPIKPGYFLIKKTLVRPFTKKVIITELQAEPWGTTSIDKMTIEQQKQLMSPQKIGDNIKFAKETGSDEFYLWGLEWWYYLKQRGDSEIWQSMKNFYQK